MRTGEKWMLGASMFLVAAGGFGLYQAEQNHNTAVTACTTTAGQEIDACKTPPTSELQNQLEDEAKLELILGVSGIAIGAAGLLDFMSKGSRPPDGDTPRGRILPFRPRNWGS